MDEINKGGLFMKTVVDKANTRGYANHGWLKTHHTFSFANYYNPKRVHFGMLRAGKNAAEAIDEYLKNKS